MSKKGFDAIPDEAGIGGGDKAQRRVVEGIESLIVIKSEDFFTDVKTSKVSKIEEQMAQNRYIKWRAKAQRSYNKGNTEW